MTDVPDLLFGINEVYFNLVLVSSRVIDVLHLHALDARLMWEHDLSLNFIQQSNEKNVVPKSVSLQAKNPILATQNLMGHHAVIRAYDLFKIWDVRILGICFEFSYEYIL